MKEDDESLRDAINELIRDEIQENINEYVDAQDETKKAGLGFVGKEEEQELKVNISNREIGDIIPDPKEEHERRSFLVGPGGSVVETEEDVNRYDGPSHPNSDSDSEYEIPTHGGF